MSNHSKKKTKPKYKNVQMIISVPNSDYCFNGNLCCPYFTNHNGPWCTMDMGTVKYNKKFIVRKTLDCQDLKEV